MLKIVCFKIKMGKFNCLGLARVTSRIMKTVIDLFCGSGAVSLGLKDAGFRVLGAVDCNPIACSTYRANHPEVNLIEGDIRNISPEIFLEDIAENLDLLVVCAPCQPFSARNRNRSSQDGRTELVLEAIRFAQVLQPKLVFFENVPGLGRQPVFSELAEGLGGLGYLLSEPKQIDAANLGVPQSRQRMILVAARTEKQLQDAAEVKYALPRTVRDVISGLPAPVVGSKIISEDPLHYARVHAPITIERLKHIPLDGGSRDSLPEHLQLACHKKLTKKSVFPDTYGRLKWDAVAPTLTTGCNDLTRGRYAHPEQNRAITLREAARLQSFPDNYVFVGNTSQIATQIGNAVPPQMMAGIARALHSAINPD
jgi:DNA (cytosine-5)-methyltransferase 1